MLYNIYIQYLIYVHTCNIYILSHKYWEILRVGYSVATSPKDEWQRCIQRVIFPGICAIINLSYTLLRTRITP